MEDARQASAKHDKRRGSAPMIAIHGETAYSPLRAPPPMKKARGRYALLLNVACRCRVPSLPSHALSDQRNPMPLLDVTAVGPHACVP